MMNGEQQDDSQDDPLVTFVGVLSFVIMYVVAFVALFAFVYGCYERW